jgi:hypothetical protein
MSDARTRAADAASEAFIAKVKQHPIPRDDHLTPFGPSAGFFFGCSTNEAIGVALDAVPDQVLADLLIERGALTQSTLDETGTLYRLTPKDPDE